MTLHRYMQRLCSGLEKAGARGFTFLEMAIAIFILGAIFLMTLNGSALVESMRAFMTSYQIQNFQQSVQLYLSSYNQLPGDDASAAARYRRAPSTQLFRGVPVSFEGNGFIDGKLWDVANANGEPFMAWRDLRYSNVLEGDPELTGLSALPENPFGGVYGFDEGNLGQPRNSLCATRIPGRAAQMIDDRLDDGMIDQGNVVATSKYDTVEAMNHFDAPDSDPYDVEKEYIICAPMLP